MKFILSGGSEMKKILWISLRAPYDSVPHAGGKTHNFYIKNFCKSNKFDIYLISFCYENEIVQLDLDIYQIKNDISIIKRNECIRNMLEKVGLPLSLFEYFHIIKKVIYKIKILKHKGYVPEIIFLHWTEIVMLLPYLKRVFPQAKMISIEEDVTFLKTERKCKQSKGIRKIILALQNKLVRICELKSLLKSDLVVLNNPKDFNLVVKKGVAFEKSILVSPYFNNMGFIHRKIGENIIIFWGAMNRAENIEAVLWFVKNVYPCLDNIRFIVVGANPPDIILKLEAQGIEITGYVDDPYLYFSKCMCMVVPLQIGAGIKIKVLEGMSAGIPILTNDIGIEGINATPGIDYVHCESAIDYIETIRKIQNDKKYANQIGNNAKRFIAENYMIDRDIKFFIRKIEEIANG